MQDRCWHDVGLKVVWPHKSQNCQPLALYTALLRVFQMCPARRLIDWYWNRLIRYSDLGVFLHVFRLFLIFEWYSLTKISHSQALSLNFQPYLAGGPHGALAMDALHQRWKRCIETNRNPWKHPMFKHGTRHDLTMWLSCVDFRSSDHPDSLQ